MYEYLPRNAIQSRKSNFIRKTGKSFNLLPQPSISTTAKAENNFTGNVIQRKFGFEIETGIRASAIKAGTTDYVEVYKETVKKYPELGKTHEVSLHLDHREDKGIIEFVTDPPFDEAKQTRQEVVNKMRTMAVLASNMASAVVNEPKQLNSFQIESAPDDGWILYAGMPGATNQSPNGYFQCTFGVKLLNIPIVYKDIAKSELRATLKDSANLLKAVDKAELVVNNLKEFMKNKYFYRDHTTGLEELTGFITLILRNIYSIKNKPENHGLMKNQMGQLFNKTPLNYVRRSLTENSKYCVEKFFVRMKLKRFILEQLENDAGMKLWHNGTNVGVYLDHVLSGRSDDVFEKFKNPWSNMIVDKVGRQGEQANAVVMENRRIPRGHLGIKETRDMLRSGLNPKHYAPNEWPGLAGKYFDILTLWNLNDRSLLETRDQD